MALGSKETKKIIRINKHGKRVEMVPPDGGWGYGICLSLIVLFASLAAPATTFGLLFNDFLIRTGLGSSAVSIMYTIMSTFLSLGSIATTVALKRFSLRQVGFVGSSLACIGFIYQIFIQDIYGLIGSHVFMTTGMAVNMSVVYTAFNSYFVKKRVLYLSLCKAIVGIFFMIYPIVVKWLLDFYGFRGTLLILAGIGFHSLIAALLLQPVKWHLVEKEIHEDEEGKQNGISKELGSNVKINIVDPDGNEKINNTKDENNPSSTLLVPVTIRRLSTPTIKVTLTERRPSMPERNENGQDNENNFKDLKDHLAAVSMLSIVSFDNTQILPPTVDNGRKKGVLSTINEYLDLSLLKDVVFLNIIIGLSMTLFSEMLFTMFFPLMLFQISFTKEQVALSLSAFAGGDMAARFILAAISHFLPLKPRYVFYSGVLMALASRIVLDFTISFYMIVGISIIVGVAKCLTHLMIPLILADHVKIEQYPAAYGLNIIFHGLFNIVLSPAIGFIRDYTQSYVFTFNVLNALFLVCIIGWGVEFIITSRKDKNS